MALDLGAIGKKIGPVIWKYDWKDVILYAVGVGAGFDELEYVFEKRLKVIPSIAAASWMEFGEEMTKRTKANLTGLLHAGHDILFHNPIPTEGSITTEGAITQMYDKGERKGAIVVTESVAHHSNGQKLFTHITNLFCRKDGGFGVDPGPSDTLEMPAREPDCEEKAYPHQGQPLIYRLSGDLFDLHVDPDFARAAGFEMPIMHGLCTHGFACRAVIKHLFPGEPERITRFRARFSRTLYPGIPIATRIWKTGDSQALFRVVNTENNDIVIDQGIVEWKE